MSPPDPSDRAGNEYIATMIEMLQSAELAGFVSVASDAELQALAPAAYWESNHSMGPDPQGLIALFRPDASPWSTPAKRSFYVAAESSWDWLRHQYAVGDIEVVVVEGVNDVLVLLRDLGPCLLAIDPENRIGEIQRLAGRLFVAPWNGEHHRDWGDVQWENRSPWIESGGAAFSTKRAMSPFVTVASWQRLDAGVWRDDIYFLHYKAQSLQTIARGRDPRSWFRGGEP